MRTIGDVCGVIVWEGNVYRVMVNVGFLVTDAVAYAQGLKQLMEESADEAERYNYLDVARSDRQAAQTIGNWLTNYKRIPFKEAVTTCCLFPHIPFILRHSMAPLIVSEINYEAYVDNLLEECEVNIEDDLQFVFYADSNLLVGTDDIRLALKYTSNAISVYKITECKNC